MRHAVFLSTLSLRRATTGNIGSVGTARHFYPRSPCGERHQPRNVVDAAVSISIHALLAESDSPAAGKRASCYHFYPRSPCGERPAGLREDSRICKISIHALLAESDCWRPEYRTRPGNFYPRSPCGERPKTCAPPMTE